MVLIVIANVCNISVVEHLKKLFNALKRTLLLLVPSVLFVKKPHRKRSQSDIEAEESKYEV